MADRLRSVGVDVGTTTTQMILSELTVENRAGAFAVPELEIADRKILYRSPVLWTPLADDRHVDGQRLREMIRAEYEKAGICRETVDTGAVIMTGETSRKENARTVLEALSEFAGDFVVATAGPDLESVLAAKGAGATELSQRENRPVLHLDIGGGTSNMALIRDGKIVATGCMNIGGRLVKTGEDGTITYVSPVLEEVTDLKPGMFLNWENARNLGSQLAEALEMAAGKRERGRLFEQLWTEECERNWPEIPENVILSFSGGVADCLKTVGKPDEFGDIGPILGQAIRESRLCRGTYVLGRETIRATVIGAGCHSAQLSGSTVYHGSVPFPIKNLLVVRMHTEEQNLPREELARLIRKRMGLQENGGILALPGWKSPEYAQVRELADAITDGLGPGPVWVAVEQDMAKALGQAMARNLPKGTPCLCLDRVRLKEGDYLDVGAPVGPALPVVIKTLIFNQER